MSASEIVNKVWNYAHVLRDVGVGYGDYVELITRDKTTLGGDKKMSTEIRKEDDHRLVDQQPANATWEDLMHEIYVSEIIKSGLEDCNAGRTKDMKESRGRYRPLNDPLTSGFMNITGETK